MKMLLDYKLSKNRLQQMPLWQRKEQRALYYLLATRQVGKLKTGRPVVVLGQNVYSFNVTNKGLISGIYFWGSFEEMQKEGVLFP